MNSTSKNISILIDAKEAAAFLGISRTNWLTRYHAGQTPDSVRLGRRVLWRVAELIAWVDAGCPPRHNWRWKGARDEHLQAWG